MNQLLIITMGVLLLVALTGCTTPPSGGYGNHSRSSSDHQHLRLITFAGCLIE